VHHSPLGNTGANKGGSLAFGIELGRNRVPAALANDHHDLALAVLVTGETAVNARLALTAPKSIGLKDNVSSLPSLRIAVQHTGEEKKTDGT